MLHKESNSIYGREVPRALFTCFFVFLMGWMIWGALYFWSIRYHSSNYFDFLNHISDRFRDFSEVNLAALQGEPYIAGKCSNYPPLALLLGKVFSLGYPDGFASLNPWEIRDSIEGDRVFTVVFGVSVFLVILLTFLWTGSKKGTGILDRLLLTAMCVCSAPLIFVVDRGNYLIFAYIPFLVFLISYEKNEILSGIALAVCACLKVYPVIFAVVFLFSKKYKGFVACILTGIIGLVVPFFFFEGGIVDQFLGFLNGCFGFGDAVLTYSNPEAPFAYVEQKSNSFSNIFRAISMSVFYTDMTFEVRIRIITILEWISKIFTVGTIALICYTVVANRNVWKKLLAIAIFSILIPGNTFNYMLLFLQPFIVWFCIEPGRFNSAYVTLLTMTAIVPKNWYYFKNGAPDVSIECVLNPLFLTITVCLLAWDTYCDAKGGTKRNWLQRRNIPQE